MLTRPDAQPTDELESETGQRSTRPAASFTHSLFVPAKDSVRGFVFDVARGKLTEVLPA